MDEITYYKHVNSQQISIWIKSDLYRIFKEFEKHMLKFI